MDYSQYTTKTKETLAKELATDIKQGLTADEAARRLLEHGPNTLAEKKEISVVLEFLSYFKSPLILILLAASIISAFLGEMTNAIIISVMVVLSVVLDFFEEHSANKAAKKLKEKVNVTATVIRDAKEKEIKTQDIVPGDLIFLNAGDLVPADARVITADDFFVNQSSLTGESYPAEKTSESLKENTASLTDMKNMVFFGTSVISGTATVIVCQTGGKTEFGQIASKLVKKEEKSEFELGVTNFGFFIMKIIIFLVLAIFLLNTVIKHQFLESFLFAIAIAVGITPELLPMIMSITMARGSLKMSKKGVIVKKLSAIPSFGGMDILCTDKTGTLTEDNIKLVTYTNIEGEHSENVLRAAYFNSYFQTGIKNTLNQAVLAYKKIDLTGVEKKEEIPFDFNRKMLSVVVAEKTEHRLITMGAPEEIFKKCVNYRLHEQIFPLKEKDLAKAVDQYRRLSTAGYRVLGVAGKNVKDFKPVYTHADEAELEFLGFVSFLDPPKNEIKQVLQDLKNMGVEVKVITGDNELVAQKICFEVGLESRGLMMGGDTEKMPDSALRVKATQNTIFARFSPDEKERIIRLLKADKRAVGYLGDGINDAPSLKTADIGISVENAVDVAKESADIVLTQKDLAILKDGILEGRKVFGNTMKYIMMGLSSNFGNMFSVLGAILFLPFLPMLPIQILLNNFIYDFSQITIPTDHVDKDWIEKPRRWNIKFIKKFMYIFGPISSVYDILTFLVLYFVFHASASVFQTGWFMESLATQTLVIHIIRTKKIPFLQSTASKLLLISTFAAVALGWIIPYTPLGRIFQFSPLPLPIVLTIVGIVIVYLICVEIGKRYFYRKYDFNLAENKK
jgi:Mg2+-importing ATPase